MTKKWTPEKLGRYLAEMGCMELLPCHICVVEPACQLPNICVVVSKLLDELNDKEGNQEGQDPNDDGLLCPNCGHHRTWPPVLTCLIAAPTFHRQRAGLIGLEEKNKGLNPLSPEAISKRAASYGAVVVWRSWRNNMRKQGRQVKEEQIGWDTLPQRDKELDRQIYEDVVTHFVAWLTGQLLDENAEVKE